jgi:hypothetical protein
MDYSEVTKNIAQTMNKAGAPLSEDQQMLLAGAISVYMEKAYDEGRGDQAKLENAARDKFIAELRKKYKQ